MINRLPQIFFVGTLTCFLSGCLMTREDLRETESHGRTQDQVASMQRAAANDTNNRFAELETSIREMNGRVEVAENKTSEIDKAQSRTLKQLEEQLAESNKKVQLLQDEVTRLESHVQALGEQVTATANAAAAASARREEAREEAPAGKGSEKRTPFDQGEEFFGKKEWKKAIVAYQKYRDQSPKGKNFPESTYKIGVCFQELGMKDEAKTFYEELISKQPGSSEARRAKIRLKKLK